MSVYVCTKVKVSSINLTGFRQGGGEGNFIHQPLQNEPLKNPPRSRLKASNTLLDFGEYFKVVLLRQMSMMVPFCENS